jgi:hypothetical protein
MLLRAICARWFWITSVGEAVRFPRDDSAVHFSCAMCQSQSRAGDNCWYASTPALFAALTFT